MNQQPADKLKNLPNQPGVYFHKNASGEIIYVGKAANLRNRVRQYFQNLEAKDPKTQSLVSEIAMTDLSCFVDEPSQTSDVFNAIAAKLFAQTVN